MDRRLQSMLVVFAIAASWAVIWASVAIALVLVIGVVQPEMIDAGEGPVDMALILGPLGLAAGLVFGGLVTILERRRTIAHVQLLHAVALGVIAAAVVGLAAGLRPGAISNACVLGAVAAPASILIARALSRRRTLVRRQA